MRKLMIALAAISFGFAANAASYVWGIFDGEAVYPNGDYVDGGTAVLLLGTVTEAAGANADTYVLTLPGSASFLNYSGQAGDPDYNWGNFDKTAPETSASVTQPSADNTSGTQQYSLVLVNADISTYSALEDYLATEGNEYVLYTGTSDYTAEQSTGDSLARMIYSGHISETSWHTVGGAAPDPGPDPVPEPTSGLLVLLGMAGLALKRKKA